jgi:hypothetical protein
MAQKQKVAIALNVCNITRKKWKGNTTISF